MSIVKRYRKKIDNLKYQKTHTKNQAVRAYMKIAKKLHELQVGACRHISREDNNKLFEISFFVEKVAERIENEYS